MVVAVATVTLALYEIESLKSKRSIVKSVIQRCRNKFNVAIAEVEDQDSHSFATIGFALVGNDTRFINSLVDKVFNFIENLGLAEVRAQDFELVHF